MLTIVILAFYILFRTDFNNPDARARNFAKIGRLYLNNGNWNCKQIVSKEWVEASTIAEKSGGSVSYCQYQWWPLKSGEDFMTEGILGQFIYVNPTKDLIIVRLGKKVMQTGGQFLPHGQKHIK